MVERETHEARAVPPLTLSAPVIAIDPKVATRRMGFRTKGPEAWTVLADALGIETVGDLLHHYPRRYIDRSRVATIRGLKLGEYATVVGYVKNVHAGRTRRGQAMVTITLTDGTGVLDLPFFNQPWTASLYRKGTEVAVSGIVQPYGRRLQLAKQEVEVLRGERDLVHTARITPIHPAAEGLAPKTIRELIFRALERLPPAARSASADDRRSREVDRRGIGPATDPFPCRRCGA